MGEPYFGNFDVLHVIKEFLEVILPDGGTSLVPVKVPYESDVGRASRVGYGLARVRLVVVRLVVSTAAIAATVAGKVSKSVSIATPSTIPPSTNTLPSAPPVGGRRATAITAITAIAAITIAAVVVAAAAATTRAIVGGPVSGSIGLVRGICGQLGLVEKIIADVAERPATDHGGLVVGIGRVRPGSRPANDRRHELLLDEIGPSGEKGVEREGGWTTKKRKRKQERALSKPTEPRAAGDINKNTQR